MRNLTRANNPREVGVSLQPRIYRGIVPRINASAFNSLGYYCLINSWLQKLLFTDKLVLVNIGEYFPRDMAVGKYTDFHSRSVIVVHLFGIYFALLAFVCVCVSLKESYFVYVCTLFKWK